MKGILDLTKSGPPSHFCRWHGEPDHLWPGRILNQLALLRASELETLTNCDLAGSRFFWEGTAAARSRGWGTEKLALKRKDWNHFPPKRRFLGNVELKLNLDSRSFQKHNIWHQTRDRTQLFCWYISKCFRNKQRSLKWCGVLGF